MNNEGLRRFMRDLNNITASEYSFDELMIRLNWGIYK